VLRRSAAAVAHWHLRPDVRIGRIFVQCVFEYIAAADVTFCRLGDLNKRAEKIVVLCRTVSYRKCGIHRMYVVHRTCKSVSVCRL